jgi:hypothetical protein
MHCKRWTVGSRYINNISSSMSIDSYERVPHTSSSSSSSSTALLNIQLATPPFAPIPSSRAASRTEARRALDWRFTGSAGVTAVGRGVGWGRAGKTKFVSIKTLERSVEDALRPETWRRSGTNPGRIQGAKGSTKPWLASGK